MTRHTVCGMLGDECRTDQMASPTQGGKTPYNLCSLHLASGRRRASAQSAGVKRQGLPCRPQWPRKLSIFTKFDLILNKPA